MSLPTPYPDLNAVLGELLAGQQAVLGKDLVALYLQGSFAHGGFDEYSDVDWSAVVAGELTELQVQSLQAMHERIYSLDCAWAQHLEGSYFPQEALRRMDRCGQPLWYLDNGSRLLIRSEHCNTLVVRWVVREHGAPLFGPPPAALLDPIPNDLLRQEIHQVMHDWWREIQAKPGKYDNRFYQGFIVLSYCRMLHSLHTGRVASKRAGAEWAKTALDPTWTDLIDRTWATRPVPEVSIRTPADFHDLRLSMQFVPYVIEIGDQVMAEKKRSIISPP